MRISEATGLNFCRKCGLDRVFKILNGLECCSLCGTPLGRVVKEPVAVETGHAEGAD